MHLPNNRLLTESSGLEGVREGARGGAGGVRGICVSSMLVGERTTAATRVSESADSAAMLGPDYALLPTWFYSTPPP